jgi:hypothetical protein
VIIVTLLPAKTELLDGVALLVGQVSYRVYWIARALGFLN